LFVFPSLSQPGVTSKLYLMFRVALFAVIPATLIPISITVSMLRYRLWDVDFVINRGLVYGALTALLVALFGGSLFVISQLFRDFSGGPLIAVAVSAAIFGAVFQPVRRWLRTFVDRRIYKINVNYDKADTPSPSPVAAKGTLTTTLGAYRDLEPIGRGGMA